MPGTRWLTEREQHAWRALQLMQMRLEAALARQLASDSELSYPDYVVLVALTDDPAGRRRPSELADLLWWERSRLSHQVTRMAARGLVRRERCASDGRGSYVAVTAKGRRAIAAAAPGHVAAVRRWFVDRLTPKELDTVRAVAEKVLAGLDAEGAREPARSRGLRHAPPDDRKG